MKIGFLKWVLCAFVVLGIASSAFGAACTTWSLSTATGTTGTVLGAQAAPPAPSPNDPCTAYGLTFSNFTTFLGAGFTGTPFSIAATFGATGVVSFSATATTGQDYDIEFEVTPGVATIILQNTGGVGINEVICAAQITIPGGSCSVQNTLGSGNVGNTGSNIISITQNAQDWIFKDVNGSSTFSQTFVPEPLTVSLMGAGLLALGLLRRKNRK